jgi:hypothetical protein
VVLEAPRGNLLHQLVGFEVRESEGRDHSSFLAVVKCRGVQSIPLKQPTCKRSIASALVKS